MGFEVVYYYHERLPSGKWNMEERLEMKKKVGNPIDDVELEKLAAIILCQLAKRDKLVVDVDVYEYNKRKINYKESTDGSGIVLKNKKFGTSTLSSELVEEEMFEAIEHQGGNVNLAPLANRNLAPARQGGRPGTQGRAVKLWMAFDPEVYNLHEAKQKGMRFTVGKKYPVYDLEVSGMGQVITVVDDAGEQQVVNDKYFVAATQIRLVGDDEVEGGFSDRKQSRKDEPRLSYGGDLNMDVPNLRPHLRRGV